MKFPSRDAGIPILTEVITPPAYEIPAAEQEQWPVPAAAIDAIRPSEEPGKYSGTEPENAAGPALSADDFDRLVDTVRESVLLQLQSRYDSVLGDRIQARLAERLQLVAADVAEEIKSELLQELDDLVAVASHKNAEDMDFKKE